MRCNSFPRRSLVGKAQPSHGQCFVRFPIIASIHPSSRSFRWPCGRPVIMLPPRSGEPCSACFTPDSGEGLPRCALGEGRRTRLAERPPKTKERAREREREREPFWLKCCTLAWGPVPPPCIGRGDGWSTGGVPPGGPDRFSSAVLEPHARRPFPQVAQNCVVPRFAAIDADGKVAVLRVFPFEVALDDLGVFNPGGHLHPDPRALSLQLRDGDRRPYPGSTPT